MACPDLAQLESYASSQLDDPARKALAQHLATCRECSSQLAEINENQRVLAPLRQMFANSSAEDEPLPRDVGSYRLLRELGRGGSAVVYEAEQRQPRRRVAVKLLGTLRSADANTARLLRREAAALARLKHPSIAAIHEAGATPAGQPYFAMELVDGQPLVAYAERRQLTLCERLGLFATVCEAVSYAHQRGVIHRDLKPSNILVEDAGLAGARHDNHGHTERMPGAPKILDFGLARILELEATPSGPAESMFSEVGRVFGTLPYMSPEHVRGDPHEIDVRSDVYSLGVILYELLTGKLPYPVERGNLAQAAGIICEQPPVPLRRIAPGVPTDVETIVLKVLAKEPGRRYASAAELAADIRRFLDDRPVLARPPTLAYQIGKFAKRNRILVASVAAGLLALVIGTLVSTWQAARARTAERDARTAQARAEREASQSSAVNEFLQKMLESPNPEQAGGDRGVTVAEILSQAVRELDDGSLAAQPQIEAAVRATIGNTYRALGDTGAAEPQLRRAVQLARELGPDGREDLAFSLNKLARVEMAKPDYAAAERYFREALEIRQDLHGLEHEEVAKLLNNLGMARHFAGRSDEAEPLLREGLQMRRRLLGDRHVDIANSLNNLAATLQTKGRMEEAEAAFRESLDMDRALRGSRHPNVAVTMANLGTMLAARGAYAEAESLMREALAIQRELYDESHPAITKGLRFLGYALLAKGDLEEAEAVQREALELDRRAGRDRHTDAGVALSYLGWVLLRQGKLEEAITTHGEALAIQREALGNDHPTTVAAQMSLSRALVQAARYFDAEPMLADAIAAARRGKDPSLARYLRHYAECLVKTQEFEAAEAALLEAYGLSQAAHGDAHSDTKAVAAELVALYKAWGEDASAAEWELSLESDRR